MSMTHLPTATTGFPRRSPIEQRVRRRARGFTMVEVLVALVVIAFGLLGLAGLQALGQRFSGNSALRTQALLLSQDIIERMRANPTGVAADSYALSAATFNSLPATPDPDCAASATVCAPGDLADYDLVRWKNTLQSRLHDDVDATIAIVAPAALVSPSVDIYTVTITLTWKERRTQEVAATATAAEAEAAITQTLASTVRL